MLSARMNVFCTLYIANYIILAIVSRTKLWRLEKDKEREAAAIATELPPPKKRKTHKEHKCIYKVKNIMYSNIHCS